jgi:hypothetical protein
MTRKRNATQAKLQDVSANGGGPIPTIDHLATAETCAPEQDVQASIDIPLSSDPLDLSRMRISPAKLTTILGTKATHIRVGRPDDQDFFQVRPGNAWCLDTYLLRMKTDREFYFVADTLWDDQRVLKDLKLYRLFYYVHFSRALGVWPVQLPAEDGTQNSWHESAMYLAEKAMHGWIRVMAGTGGYTFIPGKMQADPVWPDMSFQEVIRTAFRPKTITDVDHPKLKQLRGEVD